LNDILGSLDNIQNNHSNEGNMTGDSKERGDKKVKRGI
jgi:hypothetical protein